ncbi:MAG: hypothetical protein NTZ44_04055 [Candidatus Nomurabacteria bacterium]|nr:hypothetical protein [Candidatus Nomurabacteria bacterium]
MKISRSTLIMILIWVLGFTQFFGGPYILFRIIFWIILLPYIISAILLLFVFFKAKKIINNTTSSQTNSSETIHVEATIKE